MISSVKSCIPCELNRSPVTGTMKLKLFDRLLFEITYIYHYVSGQEHIPIYQTLT